MKTGATSHKNAVGQLRNQLKNNRKVARLMLEKKGIYSSRCVWTSLETDLGWAERQSSRDKSAWKGQVPHEHHYPSAGPSERSQPLRRSQARSSGSRLAGTGT